MVVDVLVVPEEMVRHVDGGATDLDTGRMSLRTELPTIKNRPGSTPTCRNTRR